MRERLLFVDTAKFLAICVVVISHAPLLIGEKVSVWLSIPQVFFSFYGFVVIRNWQYKDLSSAFLKLFKRVAIPYFIFSVIYAIASSVRYDNVLSFQNLCDILYASCNGIRRSSFMHLWFLPCYMLSVCLYMLSECNFDKRIYLKFLVCLFSLLLGWVFAENEDSPWSINTAFIGVVLIYIGRGLRYFYDQQKTRLRKSNMACFFVISFIAYLIFTWLNARTENCQSLVIHTMAGSRFGNLILFLASSVCLVIAFLTFSYLCSNKHFANLGRNTLAIYILHILFLGTLSSISERLFKNIGISNIILPTMTAAIFTILISHIVSKPIKKYFPLVFGETK